MREGVSGDAETWIGSARCMWLIREDVPLAAGISHLAFPGVLVQPFPRSFRTCTTQLPSRPHPRPLIRCKEFVLYGRASRSAKASSCAQAVDGASTASVNGRDMQKHKACGRTCSTQQLRASQYFNQYSLPSRASWGMRPTVPAVSSLEVVRTLSAARSFPRLAAGRPVTAPSAGPCTRIVTSAVTCERELSHSTCLSTVQLIHHRRRPV